MDQLAPNQSKTYKDSEGGTDLVVYNPADAAGSITFAVDNNPSRAHQIAGHGQWYTEVPDNQSGTVTNTGSVTLNVSFGGLE